MSCERGRGSWFRGFGRRGFQRANFFQALPQPLLESLAGRMIIGFSRERIGETGHGSGLVIVVMSVLIPATVSGFLHESSDGIPQVKWNRLGCCLLQIFAHRAVT